MRISELQTFLARTLADEGDLELSETRCSDYQLMSLDPWEIIEAVMYEDRDWMMRVHPTMSAEDHAKARRFLHYYGN